MPGCFNLNRKFNLLSGLIYKISVLKGFTRVVYEYTYKYLYCFNFREVDTIYAVDEAVDLDHRF